MRAARLAFAALLVTACKHPVAIAEDIGSSGWLQVDRPGSKPATGYDDRFSKLPLAGPDPGCAGLEIGPVGPVLILVHGIQGDGPEFESALPIIAASKPAALFMFRWVPFDRLPRISDGFAVGVSRLLACQPGREIVVLAHSAGGVVVSEGAAKIVVPPGSPDDAVKIFTVASPLAGTMPRARHPDGGAESRMLLDLGTRFTEYPPAPRGVKAVHLRTSYPADQVMKPNGDFVPNDPKVGIPGSRQVTLPETLGHVEALTWVAHKFADGTWRAWLADGP